MKKILYLVAFAAAFTSCKKDSAEPGQPAAGNSFSIPATTGSYWVYQWESIDSSGVSTPMAITDSVRVVGDTLINGLTYVAYDETFMGNPVPRRYLRDSSGYIVNQNGLIAWSYLNNGAAVSEHADGEFLIRFSVAANANVTVPAGAYTNAAVMTKKVSMVNGSAVNACGDQEVDFFMYFVSGIGMVRRETAYYGAMQAECRYMAMNLSSYYIAP